MTIKNILVTTILTITGQVLAGGYDELGHDDYPYQVEHDIVNSLLEQKSTMKEPSEQEQDSNTRWLMKQKERATELAALRHEVEIARLQEEIANSRRSCLEAGTASCPFVVRYSATPSATDTNNVYYPQITGVQNGKVGVLHNASTHWLSVGETFMGIIPRKISIDEVLFQMVTGEEILVPVQ